MPGAPLQDRDAIKPVRAINERMIAAMRLVLALAAALIVYIDLPQTNRYGGVIYAALALYIAYSATLYAVLRRRRASLPDEITHWVDIGWYMVLISLSGSSSSILFLFVFFAILVASFQWGFVSGLGMTLALIALFTMVGFATVPIDPGVDLHHFLLRSVCLLVLGYMIAAWGRSEMMLKRRLALLKDVSRLSNPRFGVDHTIGSIMERLRTFYNGDTCLLIMADQTMHGPSLRHADGQDPESAFQAEPIAKKLADLLLALPATQAIVFRGEPRFWRWWPCKERIRAYDAVTGKRVVAPHEVSGTLASESCVTVPFRSCGETVGRLYLTASRWRAFNASDVEFLLQVLEQTMPTLNNIRLVDRLATEAAGTERQRIARDLHDSVLQPYVGLQAGLAGLRRKIAAGSSDVLADIEQLSDLASAGLVALRSCMDGLKESGERKAGLVPLVQRYATQFAQTTGIVVDVKAEASLRVNDRLAAEVFQMVAEGLSNVRRHTRSTWASIGLQCCDGQFSLLIENDGVPASASQPFTPRSLMERAAALGGGGRVEWTARGSTVVTIEIPL